MLTSKNAGSETLLVSTHFFGIDKHYIIKETIINLLSKNQVIYIFLDMKAQALKSFLFLTDFFFIQTIYKI